MRSKKALKNVIATLLQQLVVVLCGFIVPKILITNFGSEANGLVTSITQFLSYIALLDLGVGSVVKSSLYKPIAQKNKEEIQKILIASEKFFKAIAKIFLIYIVVLILIYPIFVSGTFDRVYTTSLIIIIAISSFAEYYFGITYKLFLQADQKTYITSYFQIITTIINTILIVVCAKVGASLLFIKLLSSFVYFLKPILQNVYVKKKYNFSFDKSNSSYKLNQKWDALAQHVASVIHNNTDVVILTIFSTVKEVSVYSVYMLVINGIRKLIEALYNGIDASFGDMIAKKEIEHLNKSFRTYEFLYLSMITIIFSCTLILIQPFINIYTEGITDIDYNRPLFAVVIILAEYIYSIRLPYSSLTKSAGHYKETKNGAWLEAGLNLIISTILVIKYGIVGVAIGTLIAMIIRTCEFIYHSSKYILQRNLKISTIKIIVAFIELLIIVILFGVIIRVESTNFINWCVQGILLVIFSASIILLINALIFKYERKNVKELFKRVLNKT